MVEHKDPTEASLPCTGMADFTGSFCSIAVVTFLTSTRSVLDRGAGFVFF